MAFKFNILVLLYATASSWNITTHHYALLPNKDYVKTAAYVNDTIYIFGNNDNDCTAYRLHADAQCIQYQTDNRVIQQSYHVSFGLEQMCSKQYTQIKHSLYWFDKAFIQKFDVSALSLIHDTSYMIATFVPCLTSYQQYLFLLGGETVHNANNPTYVAATVFVLNLTTNEWLSDVVSMNIARKSYACTVDTTRADVYIIAGIESGGNGSIETLAVNNITSAQWKLQRNIGFGGFGHRAIYIDHSDTIIVIGGNDKYIRIIDCKTGNISQAVTQLPYDVFAPIAVLAHNILYVFQGEQTWITIENKALFGNYSVASTSTTLPASTYTEISTNETVDHTYAAPNTERTAVLTLIIILLLLVILLLCAIVIAVFCCKRRKKYKVPYNNNDNNHNNLVDNNYNNNNKLSVEIMEVYKGGDAPNIMAKEEHSDSEPGVKLSEGEIFEFIVSGDSDCDDAKETLESPRSASRILKRVATNAMDEGCNEQMTTDNDEVKAWLISIEMEIYHDIFIKHGFKSLEMIKEVNDKSDLEDIGISLTAHRLKLMNHIQKLKETTAAPIEENHDMDSNSNSFNDMFVKQQDKSQQESTVYDFNGPLHIITTRKDTFEDDEEQNKSLIMEMIIKTDDK